MTDSDRALITHLSTSVKELHTSVLDLHNLVADHKTETRVESSKVANRLESLIQAHAAFVNATEERVEDHSGRIDETAAHVAAWKAQARLVIGVAGFVGVGGFFSMLVVAVKLFAER